MGGKKAERTQSCVGEGNEGPRGEIEGCESHQVASLLVHGTYNSRNFAQNFGVP